MAGLFEALNGESEVADVPFLAWYLEAWRLVHVNCLCEVCIEVCTIYVCLFEFPVIACSKGGDYSYRRQLGCWGEGLIIVYTFCL